MFNRGDIVFEGNLLFTGPEEIAHANYRLPHEMLQPHGGLLQQQRRLGRTAYADLSHNSSQERVPPAALLGEGNYGSLNPGNAQIRETLGSVELHEDTDDCMVLPSPSIGNSMFGTNTPSVKNTASCSIDSMGTTNGSLRPVT